MIPEIPSKVTTSKELAIQLDIDHYVMMQFYWKLENWIVANRDLIKSTLVIVSGRPNGRRNYLIDMSPSLVLLMVVKFAPHLLSRYEAYLGPWAYRSDFQE